MSESVACCLAVPLGGGGGAGNLRSTEIVAARGRLRDLGGAGGGTGGASTGMGGSGRMEPERAPCRLVGVRAGAGTDAGGASAGTTGTGGGGTEGVAGTLRKRGGVCTDDAGAPEAVAAMVATAAERGVSGVVAP